MNDYQHLIDELTCYAKNDQDFIEPQDSINTKAAEAIRQLIVERDAALERAYELSSDKGTYFRLYQMACIHLTNKDEQIAKLTAERDAAFAMSRCECESSEACKNLVALHDEVERLKSALREAKDGFKYIIDEAKLTTGQYEVCRQDIVLINEVLK